MDERRAGDERLPWLETVPARATALPAAARRSRTPLLVLLALFVAGAIAVMAFLAGRTTAPAERRQAAAPLTVRVPGATPAIAPVAAPQAAVAAPAQPRASANRRAFSSRARHVHRHVAHRRARPDRRGMVPQIERAFPLAPMVYATPPAPAAPPAAKAPTPPSPKASPPPIARLPAAFSRGGVVQLGAYVSTPMLSSAWGRLVGAYPYLGTLPRMVTGTAVAGRPYYYRLRVAAGSRRQALALCDHLHRIGRGCMVIRTPA